MIIHREDYILHEGDTITCPGGIIYTICGEPIGFGGSSVVYPAVRSDTELEYALKECFPGGGFIRADGVVCPEDPNDPSAVGLLKKYRANLAAEQRIGQTIRNRTTRAVSISETLKVESITIDGRVYSHTRDAIFSVLERMDHKALSFDAVLEEIRRGYSRDALRKTKGLPGIYTTACLLEEVLTVLQQVHEQNIYYGDLHNANVYFTESCVEDGRVGIAHLLDFGSCRVLDAQGRTEELTGDDVFSTKGFRPPEMLAQGIFRLTKQADIYSAGCLLLRCVATAAKIRPLGESPAIRPGFLDEGDGERIGCAGKNLKLLNEILEKALAHDPADRYPDIQTMLQSIRRLKANTAPPGFRLPRNLTAPDHFVPGSRDRELRIMAQALRGGEAVFIWGVGGIGKTETAIALARLAEPPQGAYLVHYRNSMRETVLSLDFEGYLPPAGGRGSAGEESADYAARLDILKKHYAGALLIIDNFDVPGKTLDELRKEPAYRDLMGLGLQLVFTTRYPVPWQPEHCLQPLAAAHQLALMRRFCPDSAVTDQMLQSLIDEVGGHTLTISLIAKTLQASEGRITAADILRALRESRLSRQQFPAVVTDRNRTYEEAELYSHLKALFDLTKLDASARTVMACCAFLPDAGMDLSLFHRGLDARQIAACRGLVQQGWLTQSDNHALRVHPLIREMVRETMGPDSGWQEFLTRMQRLWEQEAYAVCTKHRGVSEWHPAEVTSSQTAQLAAWTSAAAGFLTGAPESLLWFAANLYLQLRRPVKAQHYADAALARGAAGSERDQAAHWLAATAYYYERDWPQCLEYGARADALWERVLSAPLSAGERDAVLRDAAKTCELLCRVCFTDFHYAVSRKQCRYDGALAYGRKALALAQQCVPRDHFLISRVHQMMAGTYARMRILGSDLTDGLFVGLQEYRALRSQLPTLRGLEAEQLEAAYSAGLLIQPRHASWLALLQEAMGDLADSGEKESHYRQALALRLELTVPNGETQAMLYDNIANLYEKLGDDRSALAYKMQKTGIRSSKWYIRFLEWFLLFFTRNTEQLLLRDSIFDVVKMLVLVALLVPLGIVVLVAMLLVLRDTILEAVEFFSQKRADRESLDS